VATTHGRDILGYVELAAKRDGTVLGLKMRLIADIGAYNMLLTAAIPTLTMLMANATYDIPAIRTTLTEVFTNKTPTDAYRGAGRPEATYFVERAMDMLARELNMDPADVRRKNFIASDSSHSRRRWVRCTTRRLRKALDAALVTRSGTTSRRSAMRQGTGTARRSRLSMYVEVCGIGPRRRCPPVAGSMLRSRGARRPDQRHDRCVAARPGQRDDVRPDACRPVRRAHRARHDPPRRHRIVKQGIGTFGSRSQAVAAQHCTWRAPRSKTKMAKFAAALLEAHEDDLVFENGMISVKGAPRAGSRFRRSPLRVHPRPLPKGSSRAQRRSVLRADQQHVPVRLPHLDARDRSRHRRTDTAAKLVAVDDAGI
jgi:carbon-monoxide dehydrogenase large subunit